MSYLQPVNNPDHSALVLAQFLTQHEHEVGNISEQVWGVSMSVVKVIGTITIGDSIDAIIATEGAIWVLGDSVTRVEINEQS